MSVSSVGSTPAVSASQDVLTKMGTEPTAAEPTPGVKPQNSPAATVQISAAAKKMMQEATETAAQTAKEAAGGDQQAQRLLKSKSAGKDSTDHDGDGHSGTPPMDRIPMT